MQSKGLKLAAALALAGTASIARFPATAQTPVAAPVGASRLDAAFRDPPNSARPRVWWHWMNGNISKDGIAKDLAWMRRVGIGGLQNFDANLQTPQVVGERLVYMTPGWKDAFKFAASEADRLGLELAIAASPGWSETGGPWVPPQDGLKKLVWSETLVQPGQRFTGTLAAPPTSTGPFQSLPMGPTIESLLGGEAAHHAPTHYGDAAVLAFPEPVGAALPVPAVRDGLGSTLQFAPLGDADLSNGVAVGKVSGNDPELRFDYPAAVTVSTASLFLPNMAIPFVGSPYRAELDASADGTNWRKVSDLATGSTPATISFKPVTARSFRVRFLTAPKPPTIGSPLPGVALGNMFEEIAGQLAGKPLIVGDLRLGARPVIDRFETKAGFALAPDYYAFADPGDGATGIAPGSVVDLSTRMRPDGSLDWTAPTLPRGQQWRIVRFGYSLLGTTNHPAPPEATGLEVDKFDGPAVRRYMEHYLGMYRDASGGLLGAHGVQAILTDSIEVGAANWTPAMIAQFKRLRGYDPRPWMPALAGILVGSRAQSDAFLYDYRRTLADLMASEHYGTVAKVAKEHGLKVYGEALEDRRPSLGDDMAMRSHADVPMAAMWTYGREEGPRKTLIADMRGAASVAHIYGQNIVAAESMTAFSSPWAFAPKDLRRIIDLEFVHGINRPVIHTSVHAPVDDKVPGLSLFVFGQYFNRHDTWAEMAKPWVDYISRTSLLLQQGRNVADVGYFFGEEAPLTALFADQDMADAPVRHAFDFVNFDALVNVLHNDGDEVVSPAGARYKALYLGGTSQRMSLGTLRKLAALVEGGATVVGIKPVTAPGLLDSTSAAAEWSQLVAKLWPGTPQTSLGKGRVIASTEIEPALASIGVAPDVTFSGAGNDARIPFVHRRDEQGEIYFLANQRDRGESFEASFRVTGKLPELWHADTGKTEAVSYRIENGRTIVPLTLGAETSVFVVFRKPAAHNALAIKQVVPTEVAKLGGPWAVAFQPGRGAPASAGLPELASLSVHKEPGIRYFSGTATYTRTFTVPQGVKPGQPLWLNLGEIGDVAQVRVNGREVGTVWHAPYRVEIGSAAKSGANTLEIRVANLWVNRLVGDAQPGAQKVTWTALPTYLPSAPLRPSGLIGPVTLEAQVR